MAMVSVPADPPCAGSDDGAFIKPGYFLGFALITSLFFLWAIANNFNDILIRQFQKALDLNRAQAGLIQFVFYLGYFLVALPAGMLMRRWGYKTAILTGLFLYATGALLFYPAAEVREYGLFLAALFVVASGAACLETAANPYIVAFGDPARASQRLNLAQAFNGVGAVSAPAIGGLFIFSGVEHAPGSLDAMSDAARTTYRAAEAQTVQLPYLVLAGVVLLVAAAIAVTRLPSMRDQITAGASAQSIRALLRIRTLRGAVVAQFFYVGAQVGIWSFFVDFTKEVAPANSERAAAFLLSGSLLLFMTGRFLGTALMQRVMPVRLLAWCALANTALCALAAVLPGEPSVAALMATGLFMSIMFPTIFALGLKDLGPAASMGSSLLIMAIIGGAIFPPLMGLIGDLCGSLRVALVAPVGCFAVVTLYARRAALLLPEADRP